MLTLRERSSGERGRIPLLGLLLLLAGSNLTAVAMFTLVI